MCPQDPTKDNTKPVLLAQGKQCWEIAVNDGVELKGFLHRNMNTYAIPEYLNGMVEPKYVEQVPEKKNTRSENKMVSLYLAPAGNKKRLPNHNTC